MLTVFTGGARSGKSTAATRLAEKSDAPVTMVATAQPLDDEMRDRIERHRAERPAGWTVIEEPVALADAVSTVCAAESSTTILVDCLGLWVTNRLDADDTAILEEAVNTAELLASHRGTAIVVTNEVGDGIVPDNPLSRRFRDLLGSVNQVFVEHAADAYLCVAGRALELTRFEELR